MPEAFGKTWCVQLFLCERRCTWSATEQAGEDAGGCGVLERAEGGGRGHSSEESAPVAAVDDEDWRAGGGRAHWTLVPRRKDQTWLHAQTVKSRWAAELTGFFSRAFSVKF